MPLVGCALIPNSPLLLPKLATAARKYVAKTAAAVSRLAHELYALQPSVLMIASCRQEAGGPFSLLQAPQLNYAFADWGDVATVGTVTIATGFTHALKETAEVDFPIILKSVDRLPVYFGVPVILLNQVLNKVPFVFLEIPPGATVEELNRLGLIMAEHFMVAKERIILLAAGTLAEQTKQRRDDAHIYDNYFCAALLPWRADKLINVDVALRQRVRDSIWAPTVLTAVVLGERDSQATILSYEAPAKVGYVVAQLNW